MTQTPPITEQVSSDPSRDLAALYDICWTYMSELQQLSQTQVILWILQPLARARARKSVRLTDEVHRESSFFEHSEPQLI